MLSHTIEFYILFLNLQSNIGIFIRCNNTFLLFLVLTYKSARDKKASTDKFGKKISLYTLCFNKESLYKEPTFRRPKYSRDLYY